MKTYYTSTWKQQQQLEHAAEEMAALEQELVKQGYVNTIHDCWELPEEETQNETRQDHQ